MIKITKPGTNFKYNATCNRCNAELEFDENDLQYDMVVDDCYICCPSCKKRIYYKNFIKIDRDEEIPVESDLEKIKKEILGYFDFEKVKKVMDVLDWRWLGVVPSIDDIKYTAMDLVEKAYNDKTSVATGGFIAEYMFYEDSNEACVKLTFYIDRADPCINQDTHEVVWY